MKREKLVYRLPSITQIRRFCQKNISELWEEIRRLDNPHVYYVDLSQELWDLKSNMIRDARNETKKNSNPDSLGT